MPQSRPAFLSLPDAAAYLAVGQRTMRRYVSDGLIQAYRAPGGRSQLRFRVEDVENFLRPIPAGGAPA